MTNWEEIREDFPVLEQQVNGCPLVYLDNAATMQMPQPVLERIVQHYQADNANVHRGVHTLSQRSTRALEEARDTVKRFLNAESDREIIFTSGTTGSINLVARGLEPSVKPGDEFLVSEMEHHSNLIPWQELCSRAGAVLKIIPMDSRGELDLEAYDGLLSDRTRLVAVAWVSNTIGTVNPVKKMAEMAHRTGASILVDGAQGLRHGPVDVQDLDCDYFAFSGHKVGALTGCGVLYGKESALAALYPPSYGGGMVGKVTLEKADYSDLPGRLEAGTPNYVGAISIAAALDYLSGIGAEEIADREELLMEEIVAELREIPGVRILGDPKQRCGSVSMACEGIHPFDLGSLLDAQGVAVRTGNLCAQPALRHFGEEYVLRISPAFYNSGEDLQRLFEALKRSIEMLKMTR